MRIGETIRHYRKEKNLTQEELARRLGVTAPAVNKWENGNSCPDILLLAPIARCLDISLDTLLEFQRELTIEQVNAKIAEADERFKKNTYEETFQWIKGLVEEYPNDKRLCGQMALLLETRRLIQEVPEKEEYDTFIMEGFRQALQSPELEVRNPAASSLYQFYLRKENYEEAEKCLEYFSKENPERKRKQAVIYERTGRIEEAYRTYEEILYADYMILDSVLMGLFQLAAKEEDTEHAKYYLRKREELVKWFERGEYHELAARLDLVGLYGDKGEEKKLMRKLLSRVHTLQDAQKSPLYRHMAFKQVGDHFLDSLKNNLKEAFEKEYM